MLEAAARTAMKGRSAASTRGGEYDPEAVQRVADAEGGEHAVVAIGDAAGDHPLRARPGADYLDGDAGVGVGRGAHPAGDVAGGALADVADQRRDDEGEFGRAVQGAHDEVR